MQVPPVKKNQNSSEIGGQSAENNQKGSKNESKLGISPENQKVCAACLFQVNSSSFDLCQTECKHFYHQKCIEQWIKQKNTCCLCRQKIKKYQNQKGCIVQVPDVPDQQINIRLLQSILLQEMAQNMIYGLLSDDTEVQRDEVERLMNSNYFSRFVFLDSASLANAAQVQQINSNQISQQLSSAISQDQRSNQIFQPQVQQVQVKSSARNKRPPSRLSRRNKQKAHQKKEQKIKTVKKSSRHSSNCGTESRARIKQKKVKAKKITKNT